MTCVICNIVTVSLDLLVMSGYVLGVVFYHMIVIRYLVSVIRYLVSVIRYLVSVLRYLVIVSLYLLLMCFYVQSVFRYHVSVVLHPLHQISDVVGDHILQPSDLFFHLRIFLQDVIYTFVFSISCETTCIILGVLSILRTTNNTDEEK